MVTGFWGIISAGIGIAIALLIAGIAIAVLIAVYTGKIDLAYLLSEPVDRDATGEAARPKASMSRLQLLVFTFVIAGIYLVLCLENGSLIDVPEHVLWLLGVSGGTYAASKTIKTAGDGQAAAARAEIAKARSQADATIATANANVAMAAAANPQPQPQNG